jgi:hypothetical protein
MWCLCKNWQDALIALLVLSGHCKYNMILKVIINLYAMVTWIEPQHLMKWWLHYHNPNVWINSFYYNMCVETCSCKHNMIPFMADCLVEVLILECFLFLGPQIFNWGSSRDQCALECFKKWIVGHFPSCTSGTALISFKKKRILTC